MTEQVMKQLFCRISKVNEETRTVTGIGASEAIDADGQIFDYESSKPFIEAWSAAAVARSQGKSYGNVREMHQSWAAGKLSDPIVFDDSNKAVILTSYVSDDDAWDKCVDGTYTGFSICGPIIGEYWADTTNPGVKRFTCAPIEFSLCDLPCNPEAVFTAVKAGGVTEERKFKRPGSGEKEPTVAGKTVIAQKSMYSISDLASLITSLRWTQEDLVYERDVEGDASPVPDKLKSAIVALCEVLVDMAREESSELINAMKTSGAKKLAAKAAAAPAPVATTEPTGSEADPSGTAAGAPQSTGASPETGDTPMDETQKAQLAEAQKSAAESLDLAKKNSEAIAALGESVAKSIETLVNAITAQPVAAKSAGTGVTAVSKGEDKGAAAAAATVDPKDPVSIAKSILANGRPVERQEALNIGR